MAMVVKGQQPCLKPQCERRGMAGGEKNSVAIGTRGCEMCFGGFLISLVLIWLDAKFGSLHNPTRKALSENVLFPWDKPLIAQNRRNSRSPNWSNKIKKNKKGGGGGQPAPVHRHKWGAGHAAPRQRPEHFAGQHLGHLLPRAVRGRDIAPGKEAGVPQEPPPPIHSRERGILIGGKGISGERPWPS